MFPIEYQYNPKQTVWSVDSNNFLVTELVVVDVRAKVFPKNSTLHQEIKYNTKTPRLGIFSTQSPDNLYETLEDAIESLINVPGDWSHNPFPYSIDYLANPLETIWFVDRSTLAIYSGIVESVHIKTFMKSNTLIDEIEYQVKTKLKGVETYKRVKENEIFLSYEEAFESMFGVYPTPTPTNTFGISPTPTPTHTPTPTSSLTPSITVSNSPTPTPTAGASMTPSASLTPTPSVTMTMTLTPEMTPTVTPTSSITPSITQSLTPTPSASPVWAPDHIPEILLTSKKNASGILLRRGMVVSMNSSGELIRAAASGADAINATTYLGIVWDAEIPVGAYGQVLLEGSISINEMYWDDIIKEGGHLHPSRKYYLTDQLGKISTIVPTSGYVKQVGFAVSTTQLDLRFGPLVKLRNL